MNNSTLNVIPVVNNESLEAESLGYDLELIEAVKYDAGLLKFFKLMNDDQRHSVVMAIETEAVSYLNDVDAGKQPSHDSLKSAFLNAAEGVMQYMNLREYTQLIDY